LNEQYTTARGTSTCRQHVTSGSSSCEHRSLFDSQQENFTLYRWKPTFRCSNSFFVFMALQENWRFQFLFVIMP